MKKQKETRKAVDDAQKLINAERAAREWTDSITMEMEVGPGTGVEVSEEPSFEGAPLFHVTLRQLDADQVKSLV